MTTPVATLELSPSLKNVLESDTTVRAMVEAGACVEDIIITLASAKKHLLNKWNASNTHSENLSVGMTSTATFPGVSGDTIEHHPTFPRITIDASDTASWGVEPLDYSIAQDPTMMDTMRTAVSFKLPQPLSLVWKTPELDLTWYFATMKAVLLEVGRNLSINIDRCRGVNSTLLARRRALAGANSQDVVTQGLEALERSGAIVSKPRPVHHSYIVDKSPESPEDTELRRLPPPEGLGLGDTPSYAVEVSPEQIQNAIIDDARHAAELIERAQNS